MTHGTATALRPARRGASSLPPRVVLVTRSTEYEWLLERHGTPQQADFFLNTRGQTLQPIRERHDRFTQTRAEVLAAVPSDWRRARVDRGDLDRFLFEPEDLVIALGQDGLVANLAKYLDGQPVVGLNPDPDLYEGVLVRHVPRNAGEILRGLAAGRLTTTDCTMVRAALDDGQELLALNEVFIGHRSHQSARYRIAWGGREETHSSSGLIVSTGTGATGWAKSIALSRGTSLCLPGPCDRQLAFFVREAWPSVATGVDCVEGLISEQAPLEIVSRMDDGGVIFGDGIESDRIEFGWGRRVRLSIADRSLHLV